MPCSLLISTVNILFTFPEIQPSYLIASYCPLSLSSNIFFFEKPCQTSHPTVAFSIYLLDFTVSLLILSLISSSTPSIPIKLRPYLILPLHFQCLIRMKSWNMLNNCLWNWGIIIYEGFSNKWKSLSDSYIIVSFELKLTLTQNF